MPESQLTGRGKGLSRRQVLARGAAAAGVAWAAPVIRTTRAYATGASDGTERPCTHFYIVCINRENRAWPMFPGGTAKFPASWRPQPNGNGWPEPWNGFGHPPWQSGGGDAGGNSGAHSRTGSGVVGSSSSQSANAGSSYTYRPPRGQASPGRSVRFTEAPDAGAALEEAARAAAEAASEAETAAAAKVAADAASQAEEAPPTGRALPSGVVASADAKIRSDRSVPDRPDGAQFGSRIGADLPDPLPPIILDWIAANPGVKLETPKNMPVISQTGRDGWACLLPAPPRLPDWWSRRCRLILGCYKNGNEFGGDAYADSNPRDPDQQGRRLIFSTRPERFGGYIGRAGLPGDYRDDEQWDFDDVVRGKPQRTAGPGRAVGFETAPTTSTGPATPSSPADPTAATAATSTTQPLPEPPRTGPPPVAVPDKDGLIPGVDRPRTADEAKALEEELLACGPDETLPFPWNLPYPLNLIVWWVASLRGIELPPPPPGACVAPELVVDPDDPDAAPPSSTSSSTSSSSSSSSTSSSTTPPDSSTSSSSSSTTSTTAPIAHAPRDPQEGRDKDRPNYLHGGHFDDHECIVLIFCCP